MVELHTMNLIDGKKISLELQNEIANEVILLKQQGKKIPHLAAILVGNDGGSETYVASKIKACERVGFNSTLVRHPEYVTEDRLLQSVKELNENNDIDGFIVQLPLPRHINEHKVIESILPSKDVDGFHPMNVGLMFKGLPCFLPATPFGIIKLIEHYQIETSGMHCVVIGRSDIVGKPMSAMMLQKNCTVTICHSKTKDLTSFTRNAQLS